MLEPVDEDALGEGERAGYGLVVGLRLVDADDIGRGVEGLLGDAEVSPATVPRNIHIRTSSLTFRL